MNHFTIKWLKWYVLGYVINNFRFIKANCTDAFQTTGNYPIIEVILISIVKECIIQSMISYFKNKGTESAYSACNVVGVQQKIIQKLLRNLVSRAKILLLWPPM